MHPHDSGRKIDNFNEIVQGVPLDLSQFQRITTAIAPRQTVVPLYPPQMDQSNLLPFLLNVQQQIGTMDATSQQDSQLHEISPQTVTPGTPQSSQIDTGSELEESRRKRGRRPDQICQECRKLHRPCEMMSLEQALARPLSKKERYPPPTAPCWTDNSCIRCIERGKTCPNSIGYVASDVDLTPVKRAKSKNTSRQRHKSENSEASKRTKSNDLPLEEMSSSPFGQSDGNSETDGKRFNLSPTSLTSLTSISPTTMQTNRSSFQFTPPLLSTFMMPDRPNVSSPMIELKRLCLQWFTTGRQILVFSVCRDYFDKVLFDVSESLRCAIAVCVVSHMSHRELVGETIVDDFDYPALAQALDLSNQSPWVRQFYNHNAGAISRKELERRLVAKLDFLLNPLFRGALGPTDLGIRTQWPQATLSQLSSESVGMDKEVEYDLRVYNQFIASDVDSDAFLATMLAIQVWTDYWYSEKTPKFGKTSSMLRVLTRVVNETKLKKPQKAFDLPMPDRWVDSFRWVRSETRKRIVWLTWNIETIGALFSKRSHGMDALDTCLWPLCDPDLWWETDLSGSGAMDARKLDRRRRAMVKKEMSLTLENLQDLYERGKWMEQEEISDVASEDSPTHSHKAVEHVPFSLSLEGVDLISHRNSQIPLDVLRQDRPMIYRKRDKDTLGLKWLLDDHSVSQEQRMDRLKQTLAGLLDSSANWSIVISFIASFANQIYLDTNSEGATLGNPPPALKQRAEAILRLLNDVMACLPPAVGYLDLNGDGKHLWHWACSVLQEEKAGVVLTNLLMVHEMRMRLKGQMDWLGRSGLSPEVKSMTSVASSSPGSHRSSPSKDPKFVQIPWFPEDEKKVTEVLNDAIQIARLVKGLQEANPELKHMALQRSAVSLILRVGLLHLAVAQRMKRSGWFQHADTTWTDATALLTMLQKLAQRGVSNAELMSEIFQEVLSLGRDMEVGDVLRCERKITNVPQTFNGV